MARFRGDPVEQQEGPAPRFKGVPVEGSASASPKPAGPDLGPLGAFQSGAMQGMTFGFGDEIIAGMMTPIEMGIDAFQGKPFDPGAAYGRALQESRGYDADAQQGQELAAALGNITGAVGTGLGLAKGGVTLMKGAAPTAISMGTRGAVEGAAHGGLQGFGSGDDMNQRLGQALAGAGTGTFLGGLLGSIAGSVANKSVQGAIPSVEDLKAQAGALYDQARASGVVAPQQATQQLSSTMNQIATAEGLITPTGRVNSSYPRISNILSTVDDFSQGTMDIAQAQAVRKVLTDAAKSNEPGERRIAVMMLDAFDQYLDPLAPEIATANQIYSQAMKGETIETAIELAGSRAGQFSGSGFENALRTEFRAMERAIIKGEMRGLTQAEIDAITKVAQGGSLENIARWFGKWAPTGVVSTGAGVGLPFAVGTALSGGNPVVGGLAAAGTVGAGLLGRGAATAMQLNNARQAAALSRSGGNAFPGVPANLQAVAQALIAGQGAEAPKAPSAMLRAMSMN